MTAQQQRERTRGGINVIDVCIILALTLLTGAIITTHLVPNRPLLILQQKQTPQDYVVRLAIPQEHAWITEHLHIGRELLSWEGRLRGKILAVEHTTPPVVTLLLPGKADSRGYDTYERKVLATGQQLTVSGQDLFIRGQVMSYAKYDDATSAQP